MNTPIFKPLNSKSAIYLGTHYSFYKSKTYVFDLYCDYTSDKLVVKFSNRDTVSVPVRKIDNCKYEGHILEALQEALKRKK